MDVARRREVRVGEVGVKMRAVGQSEDKSKSESMIDRLENKERRKDEEGKELAQF